jgi:hypothetical protein
MQAKDCTGRAFRRAARGVKVSRDGRFRVTVAAPRGLDVAYYRALTRVRRTPRDPRTFRTFTFLRAVRLPR